MHARILPEPPQSGSIPEVAFARSGPPVTWVEFTDDAGERWAGVFDVGDPVLAERVVPFGAEPGVAFVLARGRGYVVDVAARTVRYAAARAALVDVVGVPGRDFVIACDFQHVLAYPSRGDGDAAWQRYVSFDGIALGRTTAEGVTGYVEEETSATDPITVWREFTVRFADRRVEYGEIVPDRVARPREPERR